MNDVTNLPALAPQVAISNPIAIHDSARFEHMMKIADAISMATFLPESFAGYYKGSGNAREWIGFSQGEVRANCFLLVNQATNWGLDPFAVVSACSIVRGKLMYEGKLVHAVLQAKLGVDLEHKFIEPPANDPRALKIVMWGAKEGKALVNAEGARLEIEGTVGQWSTGDAGPWKDAKNWRRQLVYRGSREWARIYRPAVLLGVYSDDEMDDLRDMVRGQHAAPANDLRERLAAAARGPHIDVVAHVQRETRQDQGAETNSDSAGEKPADQSPAGRSPVTAGEAEGGSPAQAGETKQSEGEGPVGADSASPAPSATSQSGESGEPEPAGEQKAEKPAAAARAKDKADKEQPASDLQDGRETTAEVDPVKAIVEGWRADMSEGQIEQWDRAIKGCETIMALAPDKRGKQWLAYNKIWRGEMRPVLMPEEGAGIPDAARLHIEGIREKTREAAGC